MERGGQHRVSRTPGDRGVGNAQEVGQREPGSKGRVWELWPEAVTGQWMSGDLPEDRWNVYISRAIAGLGAPNGRDESGGNTGTTDPLPHPEATQVLPSISPL